MYWFTKNTFRMNPVFIFSQAKTVLKFHQNSCYTAGLVTLKSYKSCRNLPVLILICVSCILYSRPFSPHPYPIYLDTAQFWKQVTKQIRYARKKFLLHMKGMFQHVNLVTYHSCTIEPHGLRNLRFFIEHDGDTRTPWPPKFKEHFVFVILLDLISWYSKLQTKVWYIFSSHFLKRIQ